MDDDTKALWEAARAGGLAVLDAWCADGTLVDAAEASRRRGAPIELALSDEVVSIEVRGRLVYLGTTLGLALDHIARINRALGAADSSQRLLWWKARRASLSGVTVPEATQAGRLERCVELARGYAEEHVGP